MPFGLTFLNAAGTTVDLHDETVHTVLALSDVGNPPVTPIQDRAVGGGLIGPVQIVYLEEFDMIIVKGHPRDVQRVLDIIADIERLSEQTKPEIVIHPLKNVGSEAISTLVTQIYTTVLSSRQGRVNITPLTKPNSLLLVGRKEIVEG